MKNLRQACASNGGMISVMATSTTQPRNDGVDEAWIDEMLAESFLASDPPSWTLGREPARPARTPVPGEPDKGRPHAG